MSKPINRHFKINPAGWLEGSGVRDYHSPFFNDRPLNTGIDLLVIHCISLPEGEYGNGYISKLFMGELETDAHPSFESLKDLKVSSHLVIERTGNILQFVSFNQRAWHAGVSNFQGKENCNDYSIGIELEGTDRSDFTDQQYDVLNTLIALIQHEYPLITSERIVGHSDIAPGRKKDPGERFDWARLKIIKR
jgi:AmpD protein